MSVPKDIPGTPLSVGFVFDGLLIVVLHAFETVVEEGRACSSWSLFCTSAW